MNQPIIIHSGIVKNIGKHIEKVGDITNEHVEFIYGEIHHMKYSSQFYQEVTAKFKPEVKELLVSAGIFTDKFLNLNKEYYLSTMYHQYNFRGCSSDESKAKKKTKEKKNAEEKFAAKATRAQNEVLKFININFRSTINNNNRELLRTLKHSLVPKVVLSDSNREKIDPKALAWYDAQDKTAGAEIVALEAKMEQMKKDLDYLRTLHAENFKTLVINHLGEDLDSHPLKDEVNKILDGKYQVNLPFFP